MSETGGGDLMKRKYSFFAVVMILAVMLLSLPAMAAWKKNSSGTYVYYNSKGKALESTYVASRNAGLVRSGNKLYLYKKDGSAYHGFLTLDDGKRYFSDENGVVLVSKWIKLTSNGTVRMYRAGSEGVIIRGRIAKVGSSKYGFDENGVVLYGKQKINGNYYYFDSSSGKMITKKYILNKGNRYYAQKDGTLAVSKWVGSYYFGKAGRALRNGWVGDRYLGSDCKYLTGLHKIGNYYYYFNKSTGKKETDTTKTVNGKKYVFDSNGRASGSSGTTEDTSKYESTYLTDPQVSDEVLLSAIIYCEAGNQPFYGQLAVGLVITNRVRESSFPSTIKGVIYSKTQFEPARSGVLTNCLKNQSKITDSCKKAAKRVMSMYKANKYKIEISDSKTVSMKDYLFFMTPAAYSRLGLSSVVLKLGDHVFFKTWR